ncbi:hypothetical protein SUGI_0853990 [Cryptomeria japonica]|uniref:uncharacterized protein LOC131055974 isoform X2 n=1 Tax=Cryptomeria japonica TaxID=3369 RepID=UPI0024147B22|nr:uncharacterized protein LOC131055974 isoform X2 [Cryptomeria japonica]GLJ41256.1 hypothetical protein SUGI_0853990 [Cryptomeria japonica]
MKGLKEKSTVMKTEGKRKSSSDEVPCNSSGAHSRRRLKRDCRVIESPAWLPKGWITEIKTRVTGGSAGITDKYYYDPVTNKRFASKTKVFEFLEGANFTGFETKCKKDDLSSKTSVEERTNIRPGGGGTESIIRSFSASQGTSGIDANKKPNKVIWVLNGTEESWVPLVNNEVTNGSNRKEEKTVPHGNSVDSYSEHRGDQEQLEKRVSEHSNPSKELVKETQPEIDLNKPNEGSPIVSPFGDSWPDPCLEFAFKTLTGAIPIFDDNSALRDAFQNYILPQEKADEKQQSNSSPSNPGGSSCNEPTELPSSTAQRLWSPVNKFDESKDSTITVSVSDGLPDIGMKVNNLMRHQAKDLLEPLGRNLCKKALAFLIKNGQPNLFFGETTKNHASSILLAPKTS